MRRAAGALVGALVAGMLTACAGLSEITEPKPLLVPVSSVTVSPTAASVVEGNSAVLQARLFDELGRPLSDRPLLWSSSDTAVVRVTATGEVAALRAGTARVSVSAEGKSAIAVVSVSRRAVASIQVSPPNPSLFVNGTLPLVATPVDDRGQTLLDRAVLWQSSAPAVAIVNASGVVSGLATGVATITATSENRSAAVGVSVLPVPTATVQLSPSRDSLIVGQSTQFTAVARDAGGAALADRVFGWSSDAAGVATVSSSGLVLGVAPGTVTITASNGGRSGDAVVRVLPRPVGAVIVSPSQSALTVGQTLRLTVQVTDDNGTLLTGRPVTFLSSNGAVARVAGDGTVTASAPGSTVISAFSEGRSGTATVTVSASPVASVRVSPATVTLQTGATSRFTADALDASGAVLAQRAITWLSGAPSFFSVNADGTVTGVSPGAGVLFASAEGRIGSAAVVVQGAAVSTVSFVASTPQLFVGDTRDFTLVVRDAGGAEITGRLVQWASSAPMVAVVSGTGRVRAVSPGSAVISGTVDGIAAVTTVTVAPVPVAAVAVSLAASTLLPGQSTTAAAVARSQAGDVLTGRAVAWTSLSPAVATVTATGTISALSTGTAVIRATVEGIAGQATLTVSPTPVASVLVSVASATLFVGQSTQASADLRGAANQPLSGRAVVWTSSNTAIATVSAAGVVSAVAPGTALIIAVSEGVSNAATVTVSNVPVASVTATLTPTSIQVGATSVGTAVTRDGGNNVLTGRVVTWASSNTAVATVSGSGVVTGVSAGSATITATSESVNGTATITVTNAPVASVTATLTPTSILVGATSTGAAVMRDASNNVLTGRTVTWASSNAAVATVSGSGVVTGVSAGSVTITATSEGVNGTASITVTNVPVASVTATLTPTSIAVGATSTGSAVTRDASNNILTGRTITWASSNTAVATVSAGGVVTGVSAGSATITATSEGVNGTASITVTNVPVASVTATLSPTSVAVGATSTGTAVTRDASNNVLTGRTITWATSNTAVATVNGSGVVTGVSAGSATITATSEGVNG
ncbi:beta strand repeat-containing protein, partial [Gemmatimonas sp.]|uniref:beta strand repeat-containing protein n=1 Tax=Gemmatimonas sp. TaxID=1962908 RepID=UPI003F70C4AA